MNRKVVCAYYIAIKFVFRFRKRVKRSLTAISEDRRGECNGDLIICRICNHYGVRREVTGLHWSRPVVVLGTVFVLYEYLLILCLEISGCELPRCRLSFVGRK